MPAHGRCAQRCNLRGEGLGTTRVPEDLPPPRALAITIKLLDTFGEWVGTIVAFLVVPLIAALVYDASSRYFFNRPVAWVFPLTYFLVGGILMLGAGYTLLKKMHVRTDILYERWPVRWQGVVDATLYPLIFFPGMIFFLIKAWEMAYHSYTLGEKSGMLPFGIILYTYYLKMAIPIGTGLLLIQGVSEFLKSVYAVWRGRWL